MKSKTTAYFSAGVLAQLAGTVLFSTALHAADPYIRFEGTMIEPPPCKFNGGSPINVVFGDAVITTRVNGINYSKDIAYNLVCTSPSLNTLRIQLKGSAASFDTKKLETDNIDLGIALTSDGKELLVNQWVNFTNPARPVLKAVPVKKTGTTLRGGKFTATATMMVDYQ